jgi:hypothetical protein
MIKHSQVQTLSIGIARDSAAVYAYASQPENLPHWAAGLGMGIGRNGDHWLIKTPQGDLRLDFTPRNELGVMDHTVTLADGTKVYVPMRVVPNGEGSEVSLTLFRQLEMDDAAFERDAATMRADLEKLKAVLESGR